jgi:hypothetical protein
MREEAVVISAFTRTEKSTNNLGLCKADAVMFLGKRENLNNRTGVWTSASLAESEQREELLKRATGYWN